MRDQGLSHIYARYVPRLIVERLIREARAVDAPSAEQFQGAVLFADISGFTPLTETFAEQGPQGAEALTRILNDYFGRLTRIVATHGGDVLKFAGDALMALWRPQDEDLGMTGVCHRAAQCGLELQASLAGYQAEGHPLNLRVAIGVGNGIVVHIGGQFNRWEFAVAGAPLNQVGRVGDLANPGEVLVSAEVWARIGRNAQGTPVVADDADPDLTEIPPWKITDISTQALLPAPPAPALPEALEGALRGYLPAAITRRIIAGQTDFLGELRRLTIVFINLPDLHYDTPLEQAQEAFRALQKALYFPWEGSINKLSVDDKGISLVAALGLPPFAHEDDAARGAQAAMAMHAALKAVGQRCSIGVTTGRVYCGSVGGDERQEYTIMGDRVNLAARLMQNADGYILCDQATVDRSDQVVRYSEPRMLRVKGKSLPLPVFRPEGQRERAAATRHDDLMIGREAEAGILENALESLIERGESRCIYVEGEAGVGKSRLIEHFSLQVIEGQPARLLEGAGDAIEQSTSYFAWQNVLLGLFELTGEASNAARRDHILERLSGDQEALELVPLLNGILPLEIPENDLTRQMSGEVRAGNLHALMVNLLQFSTTRKPLVLILDDVHWLDSSSWELLRNVVQQVPQALVVLGSRPISISEAPEQLRALLDAPGTETIHLERMDPEECVALVARRLDVEALPDAAAQLIRDRGEGHPFFSEEIGFALRDAGILTVRDGQALMSDADAHALESVVPDTIEGIITSRIDRLNPQQQLALKVASCIGRVFTIRLLQGVYPIGQDRATLPDQLVGLANLDLTPLEAPEPEQAYIFKHAITRQVAYDLMLYAQRKQLHEAIATWYEQERSEDLAAHYPLLAHHWGRAENDAKAVHFLELAAEQALRANANAEVVEFIEDALERAERLSPAPTRLQRARWLAMLGSAQHSLGRLDQARHSLEAALEFSGYPTPSNNVALIGAILRQALTQVRHRIRGVPEANLEQDARECLELAATTLEELFLVYFFANDAGRMLWSTLRSTNLAERAGRVSGTLVRCYTNVALALQAIPLQKQVEHYGRRAVESATENAALPEKAWAGVATSACLAATGQWDEIERRSQEAVEINRQLGDMRRWEEASANLALIRTIYGRFDEPQDSLYLPVLEAARKRRIRQTEGWGLTIWGMNLQYMQRFDALDEIIVQLKPWYETASEGMDDIARLEAVDLLALSGIRKGDDEEAERWLDEGITLLRGMGRPSQYRNLPATYLLAEAALDYWLAAPEDAGAPARGKQVRQVIAAIRTYSGIFPIGRPRLNWVAGRYAWGRGRDKVAEKSWRACLETAEPLHMHYDRCLASGALANLLGTETDEGAGFATLHRELCRELRIPGSSFIPPSRMRG